MLVVLRKIDKSDLKGYKDYVGYLFSNENGVINKCENEEDVIKSNQWFNNLPLDSFVVDKSEIKLNDKFLAFATNQTLNNKVFKYVGFNGNGLVYLEDEEGNQITSTEFIFDGALKWVRPTTDSDKDLVLNNKISILKI